MVWYSTFLYTMYKLTCISSHVWEKENGVHQAPKPPFTKESSLAISNTPFTHWSGKGSMSNWNARFGTSNSTCKNRSIQTFVSGSRLSTHDPERETEKTQQCPLKLCNKTVTGLHNALVQMNKRIAWVLAQLAGSSGALAGFQLPLAPFMMYTNHITIHRAWLAIPYTKLRSLAVLLHCH